MISITHLIVAPDSEHLGRLDPAYLSDQTLMEMLVAGFENREDFLDENENYKDIKEWPCVAFRRDKLYLIEFEGDADDSSYGGSLNLRFIPESVTFFSIEGHKIKGTLYPQDLSSTIAHVHFSYNLLSGSIDTEKFPDQISTLSLDNNDFSGSLDLTTLPKNLTALSAECNRFKGTINLSNLPHQLTALLLDENEFTGMIDLGNLPEKMHTLKLNKNLLQALCAIVGALHRSLNCSLVTINFRALSTLTSSLPAWSLFRLITENSVARLI